MILDKNDTNQFQESISFSLLQQNISEMNLEESQSQCLKTASEQLKQHLNSSCGFSNLDEYNSHIVPPRKTLGNIQHNIITPPIGYYIIIIHVYCVLQIINPNTIVFIV